MPLCVCVCVYVCVVRCALRVRVQMCVCACANVRVQMYVCATCVRYAYRSCVRACKMCQRSEQGARSCSRQAVPYGVSRLWINYRILVARTLAPPVTTGEHDTQVRHSVLLSPLPRLWIKSATALNPSGNFVGSAIWRPSADRLKDIQQSSTWLCRC